ncbi:MAG: hybrid sensor histidine kinase/response regulator [Pseudanabaena sp. ELA645]|jgi:CheY-like chemotaxis protein
MNTLSILVVGDEPNNFDVIESLLDSQDYILHYVDNGQEAIDRLDMLHPDLILLDVMMPDIDGIEVCRRIKNMPQWESVPIIMVTTLSSKQDLSRCLEAGADDFISKPVNVIELRARVRSMLRIKQQFDRNKTLSNLQKNTIDFLQNNLDGLCGNLASTLPHEINTPLNGIVSVIDLLISEYPDMDTEEFREFLFIAKESAHRLEKLTKRFLKYSELEMLTSNPQITLNNISKISTKISTKILIKEPITRKAQQENRLADLNFELINTENIEIPISDHDFLHIIGELTDNAFKFSKPATPVTVSSQLKDGTFHLSISDRGRGMTEEQIAKIGTFTQFERKYYEQQGIGLGLQIVKKIVVFCGGSLSISSIYKQGTTVHIKLPIV